MHELAARVTAELRRGEQSQANAGKLVAATDVGIVAWLREHKILDLVAQSAGRSAPGVWRASERRG